MAAFKAGGGDLTVAAVSALSLEELRRRLLRLEERLDHALSHLSAANFSDDALAELKAACAAPPAAEGYAFTAADAEGNSTKTRQRPAEAAVTVAAPDGDGECRLTVKGLTLRGLPLCAEEITAANGVLLLGGEGVTIRLVGDVTVNGQPLSP